MHRVLLVDDDPSNLKALEQLVRRRGWEPVVAESGPEALGLVAGADAVVTDFSMPGMNGLELVAALRAHDDALPVILVTGEDRLAREARRAGAYDYLTKPFDADELQMALDRALEARGLRLELRRLRAAAAA